MKCQQNLVDEPLFAAIGTIPAMQPAVAIHEIVVDFVAGHLPVAFWTVNHHVELPDSHDHPVRQHVFYRTGPF